MSTAVRSSILAIEGGPPVRRAPLAPWPHFTPEEIEAAAAVLRSGKINYWTGDECRLFEREYAAHTGMKHAIALMNGTVALELALVALGIGPGDEVITTSRTFIASASCAVMRGATPVIADVDRDSGNITIATIKPLVNPRTKAIIVVHLGGWPCEMDPIIDYAQAQGIHVIEDCAQANGATYKGRPVGSFGIVNCFSFCQDKIITTSGEGGMLVTNDEQLWRTAWAYKDHGKSFAAVYQREHAPGFRWLHESFGTNWRMTEVQGAIGRRMLQRLPQMLAVRRSNAQILSERLSRIPALRVPKPPSDMVHAFYKFYFHVRPERLREGWTRDRIMNAITAEGIPCFSGSCSEIYRELAFTPGLRPVTPHPVAHELGMTSLMFMVHPTLAPRDMEDVCLAAEKVMAAAST
jgi:dTDP-4-amino-4,6-dideoxygalactose transaminase